MQPIGVVALGCYRDVAIMMDRVFEHTSIYRTVAIVDLFSNPADFTYTAHNFGVVLHCLHPPPQVFIVGAAISTSMMSESIRVWDEYIKNKGTENTLVVNLSGEPPADGNWMLEIIRRLDAKYKGKGKTEL